MPINTAIGGWLKVAGVDHDHYGEIVRRWVEPLPGEISPVHRLERGELALEDFEQLLSAALAREGSTVDARGLVGRMFADLAIYEDTMTSLVTRARAAGIRTALLSNSWGNDYDRSDWHEMFDTSSSQGRSVCANLNRRSSSWFCIGSACLQMNVSSSTTWHETLSRLRRPASPASFTGRSSRRQPSLRPCFRVPAGYSRGFIDPFCCRSDTMSGCPTD